MIDQAVERQYTDTKELKNLWATFQEFCSMAEKGGEITPDKESQFLELKSRIAMLHDSFMEALTHNQNIGQDVLNIISRAITLKHLSKQSTADNKKMEIEWHEAYMLINETIGSLEQKRNELANINEAQFKAKKAAGVAGQKARNFFGSFYFKLAVIIVALIFATIGVQMLGLYDYDELGKVSAIEVPYRWGKYGVRKVWNATSPWPRIDSRWRLQFSGWPEGLKPPKTISTDQKEVLTALYKEVPAPAPFFALLSKAIEYKDETSEKGMNRPVEVFSFRFPSSTDVIPITDMWEKQLKARFDNEESHVDITADVNVLSIIWAPSDELMLNMKQKVYGDMN